MVSFLASLLIFVFIIGLVVNIHELGHFLAAKLSGMKVEEFSFGFGPRIWAKKYGETEYRWSLLPIGGYVKILGQEEESKSKRSYTAKPKLSRFFVLIAGILMNVVLAVILFQVMLLGKNFTYTELPYFEDLDLWFGEQRMVVVPLDMLEETEDIPSNEEILAERYQILEVEGEEVETLRDVADEFSEYKSETINLKIRDAEGNLRNKEVDVSEDGKIGILAVWEIEYSGGDRYLAGPMHFANMVKSNFFILGRLFRISVEEGTAAPVAESVNGPVGLFFAVDIVKETGGLWDMINLVAILNLVLAMVNLLPLPSLDGGHILFLGIEAVRGKPLNQKLENWISMIGLSAFMLLAVVVFFKDIWQFGVWDAIKGVFEGLRN